MKQRPFLALWAIAVAATVAAFVLHLALRGRTVTLGYKLGRARAEQARLREVKRVLSLEAASYETPQRVEMVARSLLGMTPPPPERVIPVRAFVPLSRVHGDVEGYDPSEAQPLVPVADAGAAAASADGGAERGRAALDEAARAGAADAGASDRAADAGAMGASP